MQTPTPNTCVGPQIVNANFRWRNLYEVSKRDSDLDSLRAKPAFQAILTDSPLLAHVPVSDLISPQDLHEIIRGTDSSLGIDVRGPEWDLDRLSLE
jgi:hypothetical protein